jgi:quinol-cytochrome oxidoreductase complex cytochrome b subunit
MPKEPVIRPSSSEKTLHESVVARQRRAVMIARVVGILCVASGFILGIHGLDHPGSPILPTALGIILTGVVAQVFALVKSCYLGSQGNG